MTDRAAITATAIMAIVCDHLREAMQHSPPAPVRDKAHAAVAAYLRDEILDIERQARSERRLDD